MPMPRRVKTSALIALIVIVIIILQRKQVDIYLVIPLGYEGVIRLRYDALGARAKLAGLGARRMVVPVNGDGEALSAERLRSGQTIGWVRYENGTEIISSPGPPVQSPDQIVYWMIGRYEGNESFFLIAPEREIPALRDVFLEKSEWRPMRWRARQGP